MTGPARILVVVTGLGLSVLIGVLRDVPGSELLQLVGISVAAALLVGGFAIMAVRLSLATTLRRQVVIVALASVVATAFGTLVAARAMFVASHDLTALLVVLTAAATVGLLGALELGARVGHASRALGELTRRIGDQRGPVSKTDVDTGRWGGELDALAAELETMSRRLNEARERERVLERSRRELVAWVSHDLRTPLAGIRAMAEALQDGVVDDPPTIDRYHRTIQSETERLTRLVDDLFELSRIHADAVHLTMERGPLGDVVSDALGSAQAVAAAKGIHLDGRLLDPPVVEVATSELGRVLRNLLDNAIRHTPGGGTVTVEVGARNDHAYITVSDQCGGIPESDMDRVFDLAYRGDAARTPGDGGGGLGLAIARGLVEAHAGDLLVRNNEAGCQFTVRLPKRPDL